MSHKTVQVFQIICLSMFSIQCFAQSDTTAEPDTIPYYINIDDYFNLSADLETDFESFQLKGEGFEYDIRPNFEYVNLVGIDYRALSFFISFKPNLGVNSDNDLKGKSEHTGFGFSFNTSKMINHVGYSFAKGFYLENTLDYDPNFIENSSPYIQFPDLEVTSFRGSHAFKTNPNFSYGAFSVQMARQTRSAGTLAPGLSYNYYKINNGTGAQRSTNLEILFNLPYYYTHVIDQKWYGNVGVIGCAGMTNTWLTTTINGEDFKSNINSFIMRGSAILGLGYNSKGLFAGVEGKAHRRFQNQGGTGVKEEIDGFSFRVFVGFHIKAPHFINRAYDKFEAKFLGK